jgi:hypothetical protein
VPSNTAIYVSNGADEQQTYEVSSGSTYTLDVTGGTGTWSVKLAYYGKISQLFTFTPAAGGIFSFSPTLLTDLSVVDTLSNVSIYTDLGTAQKIYDYISYYATTNAGIVAPPTAKKSFGAIDFVAGNLILNPNATLIMSGSSTLTIKTAGLTGDDTYYSTGDFTQSTATLSENTRIRMANLNSELEFIGVSKIDLYSNETDRDNRDNLRMSLTTSPYRFLYGAIVNSVLFQTTLYSETTASVQYEYDIPLINGNNVLALDTTTLLLSINNAMAREDTLLNAKTSIGEIKSKTDNLAFTIAGQVDSNLQYVNDIEIKGTGTTGDEWGPE